MNNQELLQKIAELEKKRDRVSNAWHKLASKADRNPELAKKGSGIMVRMKILDREFVALDDQIRELRDQYYYGS